MPGTILSVKDAAINEIDQVPTSVELTLGRQTTNKLKDVNGDKYDGKNIAKYKRQGM